MQRKPTYNQGDWVVVNLPDMGEVRGTIVGIASEHIIDMWIVESWPYEDRQKLRACGYEYSCFVAPTPLISLIA